MTISAFERRLAKVEDAAAGGGCFLVFAGPAEGARGWEVEQMRQRVGRDGIAVYLGRQGGDKLRLVQTTRDLRHESWVDVLDIAADVEARGGTVEFLDFDREKAEAADVNGLAAMVTWLNGLAREAEVYFEGKEWRSEH